MRDFVRTDNSRRLLNLPNGSFPLLILIFQEKNWVFGFLAVQKTEQILYPFHIKVHCLSKEWSDIIYFDAIKVYVTYFPIPIFYKEKKTKWKQKTFCVLVAYHHDYGDSFLHLLPHSPVIQSDLSSVDNTLSSNPNLDLHQLQLTLSHSIP